MKKIYDALYGLMDIPDLCLSIINTYEFQRLRDLKQLGVCSYIFPSGTHSRFEHSLGVMYLSSYMLHHLSQNHPIDSRTIQLIEVAALIHDIGHGPFSHAYDVFCDKICHPLHEDRCNSIFISMNKKYDFGLSDEEVQLILDIVHPKETHDSWIYEIVANKKNSLDVDKLDYINRDCHHLGLKYGHDFCRLLKMSRIIDNHICFSDKLQYDIYSIFMLRFRLHKQIYNHPAVCAFEIDLIDFFIQNNMIFSIDMTDSTVLEKMKQQKHPFVYRSKKYKMVLERTYNPKIYNELQSMNMNKSLVQIRKIKMSTDFDKDPLSEIKLYNQKLKVVKPTYNSDMHETILRVYSEEVESDDVLSRIATICESIE